MRTVSPPLAPAPPAPYLTVGGRCSRVAMEVARRGGGRGTPPPLRLTPPRSTIKLRRGGHCRASTEEVADACETEDIEEATDLVRWSRRPELDRPWRRRGPRCPELGRLRRRIPLTSAARGRGRRGPGIPSHRGKPSPTGVDEVVGGVEKEARSTGGGNRRRRRKRPTGVEEVSRMLGGAREREGGSAREGEEHER
jgi:hypothetical protein